MIKKGDMAAEGAVTSYQRSSWKLAVTHKPPEKKWTLPLELARDIKLLRRGESFFKVTEHDGRLDADEFENEVNHSHNLMDTGV
jgi:hypothetical protein